MRRKILVSILAFIVVFSSMAPVMCQTPLAQPNSGVIPQTVQKTSFGNVTITDGEYSYWKLLGHSLTATYTYPFSVALSGFKKGTFISTLISPLVFVGLILCALPEAFGLLNSSLILLLFGYETSIMKMHSENENPKAVKPLVVNNTEVPTENNKTPESAQDQAVLQIESTKLTSTIINATIDQPITNDKNSIYCTSFQLAWNALERDVVKEPIALYGNPQIAQSLNKKLIGEESVEANSYIALAGFGRDGIVRKVKDAVKNKFNDVPGFDLSNVRPSDIISYAMLKKNMKFKNPFDIYSFGMRFKDQEVQAFGIDSYNPTNTSHVKMGEQVKIYDYNSKNDFILTLDPKTNDEIILAKVNPENTLGSTIEQVVNRISQNKVTTLDSRDKLQIPVIDFNLIHSYEDLLNKNFLNKKLVSYFITKAAQTIQFKLNNKGAELKSEAIIAASKGISYHKNLVFNKPFLLCVRKKGAEKPYLALWVSNPEILKVFNKSNDK